MTKASGRLSVPAGVAIVTDKCYRIDTHGPGRTTSCVMRPMFFWVSRLALKRVLNQELLT